MAKETHGKISIDAGEILKKHGVWASAEADDSSRAGKRREAIGAYREGCGINAKAFSQFRAGMKIKGDGDRKDWVRSMRLLIDVAEREVFANEPDMFGADTVSGADDADEEGDAPDPSEMIGDDDAPKSNVTPIDFGGEAGV